MNGSGEEQGRRPEEIAFVCPACKGELVRCGDGWSCREEGIAFQSEEGTADFILPERREAVERFLARYQQVRKEEGWGGGPDAYYPALPYRDVSGRQSGIWRTRARTFDSFLAHLARGAGSRRVLDIGAGNGWLSVRLAERGYDVVALDINPDPEDGLGVLRRTAGGKRVLPVRAEFDALPFRPGSFDVAVFNASLHYSHDVVRTLEGAMQTVGANGSVYILDSPLYRDAASGTMMVQERERGFAQLFGIAPEGAQAGGFLTFGQIETMRGLYRVEEVRPRYGIRWRMRPAAAKVLGRREPATFEMLVIQQRPRED